METNLWKWLNLRVCPWWLRGVLDNSLRRLIQEPERILSGLVAPGQVVADIGCGIGYFTIPLARLVGPQGRVLAIDLQETMLAGVQRRAAKVGLSERIQLCRATPTGFGVEEPVDFALTFFMIHEVPDQKHFLEEIHSLLKPGGRWLLTEPPVHVTAAAFAKTVALADATGFSLLSRPRIAFSHTALFLK
ncbi:MAG: class I SAM-dependent methyltransferase [Deltaproteobacteria bacterium]|nr:class I SAM-dependent methyltransferase [Deltaproteobacteria bacterium]